MNKVLYKVSCCFSVRLFFALFLCVSVYAKGQIPTPFQDSLIKSAPARLAMYTKFDGHKNNFYFKGSKFVASKKELEEKLLRMVSYVKQYPTCSCQIYHSLYNHQSKKVRDAKMNQLLDLLVQYVDTLHYQFEINRYRSPEYAYYDIWGPTKEQLKRAQNYMVMKINCHGRLHLKGDPDPFTGRYVRKRFSRSILNICDYEEGLRHGNFYYFNQDDSLEIIYQYERDTIVDTLYFQRK